MINSRAATTLSARILSLPRQANPNPWGDTMLSSLLVRFRCLWTDQLTTGHAGFSCCFLVLVCWCVVFLVFVVCPLVLYGDSRHEVHADPPAWIFPVQACDSNYITLKQIQIIDTLAKFRKAHDATLQHDTFKTPGQASPNPSNFGLINDLARAIWRWRERKKLPRQANRKLLATNSKKDRLWLQTRSQNLISKMKPFLASLNETIEAASQKLKLKMASVERDTNCPNRKGMAWHNVQRAQSQSHCVRLTHLGKDCAGRVTRWRNCDCVARRCCLMSAFRGFALLIDFCLRTRECTTNCDMLQTKVDWCLSDIWFELLCLVCLKWNIANFCPFAARGGTYSIAGMDREACVAQRPSEVSGSEALAILMCLRNTLQSLKCECFG